MFNDAFRTYVMRVLVAFDVLVNTILNGDDDMTLSLRAERAKQKGRLWGRIVCRLLDLIQPGHCTDQLDTDEGKEDA